MYRLILTNRKYSFENSNFFEMLKTTFHKEQPKKRIYCEYKTFPLETFSSGSFLKLESQENKDYQTFEKNFVETFNNQAPKMSKILRGSQKPHINKTLRNAIMKRSKLKNEAKSVDDLIK